MSLFKVIDGLLVGTRYGVLALSVLGILFSVVLFFFNLTMGVNALMVFVATLALSLSLTLFLLPKKYSKGSVLNGKEKFVGIILGVIALSVMGLTYFTAGGFPELNLLFM